MVPKDGGEGNPPPNPNPGGSQGDEKLFTQADLDRIIQDRLKQDRERRSKEGLTDSERHELQNRIEGLQTQLTSLKTERDAMKTRAETAEAATKETAKAYRTELINRAIGQAAQGANAIDSGTVSQLLQGRTRAREVTDDGKPTGNYVVEVKVNRTVEGKEVATWVTPEEGVKDLLEKSPFLAKSQTPAGAGTKPAEQPAGARTTPELPKGVVASGMPGVGALPVGGKPGQSNSDLFSKAGSQLEEALKAAK